MNLSRRELLLGLAGGFASAALPGCGGESDPSRYTPADIEGLALQRETERVRSGQGPFEARRYRGHRGLAELPWVEPDSEGRLRLHGG